MGLQAGGREKRTEPSDNSEGVGKSPRRQNERGGRRGGATVCG